MSDSKKEFTVALRDDTYAIKAERFVIDGGVLKFLNGTETVAAFAAWERVY